MSQQFDEPKVRIIESVGMEFILMVDELPDKCTKDDIISFFTFNGIKPIKCEIGGLKGFESASLWYETNSLALIALKNYYGVKFNGHKTSMHVRLHPMYVYFVFFHLLFIQHKTMTIQHILKNIYVVI